MHRVTVNKQGSFFVSGLKATYTSESWFRPSKLRSAGSAVPVTVRYVDLPPHLYFLYLNHKFLVFVAGFFSSMAITPDIRVGWENYDTDWRKAPKLTLLGLTNKLRRTVMWSIYPECRDPWQAVWVLSVSMETKLECYGVIFTCCFLGNVDFRYI